MRSRLDGTNVDVGVSALVLAYNLAIHRALPHATHLPANLTAAAVFVLLARRAGATLDDMGLRPERAGAGVRTGLAATAPIAAAIALTAGVPASRGLYDDHRVTQAGARHVVYRALVRTPLAIALPEEAIFRGALLGLFLRNRSPSGAAAWSALGFGLWHVLPTLDTLRTTPVGALVRDDGAKRLAALAGMVAATAGAGAGFAWLRLRSGSLVAPVLAHSAVNGLAFVAGHLLHRCNSPTATAGREGEPW